MHLLVVDDVAFIRNHIARTLRDGGYEVGTAETGANALRQLAAHREIGVVVTDYEMPGMSGTDLCRACRKQFPDRDMAFILLTASNDLAGMRDAKALGFRDVLVKPPDYPRLFGVLESLGCLPIDASAPVPERDREHPTE